MSIIRWRQMHRNRLSKLEYFVLGRFFGDSRSIVVNIDRLSKHDRLEHIHLSNAA